MVSTLIFSSHLSGIIVQTWVAYLAYIMFYSKISGYQYLLLLATSKLRWWSANSDITLPYGTVFGGRFFCSRPPKQSHDAMVNGNLEVASSSRAS